MRVIRLDAVPRRGIESPGSAGLTVGALGITADAHLVVVRLRPRGVIGRHPTAARQLLAVVSGDATVSGHDGVPVQIGPGHAAVWEPNAIGTMRSATAAAEPLDDPPGVWRGSCGLRVLPGWK